MYEALGDVSLDLLRAFEAARRRSFTAAAMELGTTQPAISQQIKRLEEQLAIRLFDRIYRGIELTDAGPCCSSRCKAVCRPSTGLSAISQQDQHEVLQVATDFAFAAYWLMPRLHRFHAANPQVDVSLVTSERNHATLRSDIDVAVLFGDGRFKQGEPVAVQRGSVPGVQPAVAQGPGHAPDPGQFARRSPAASAPGKQQPLVRLERRVSRAGHQRRAHPRPVAFR
jgi:DNA-binding transcriptional LysR family regulator